MERSLLVTLLALLWAGSMAGQDNRVTLDIQRQYLNLSVSHSVDRAVMRFQVDGQTERSFLIRLAPEEADYWVFADVSAFVGKTLTILYDGDPAGLERIYQESKIRDEEKLYREKNRPQFHFTARRGWINDPNGLIFYDGEYHLFFQHNPYEREWENMHWGHAVSTDLVHWTELPEALYPDELGTMFSGSAVIDYGNDAGFNEESSPAMLAFYTADSPDRQAQCMAYSLDCGRTWTKYDGNPLIDSKEVWNSKDTRDPKVFRYELGGHWVMVLNERDGHSIYTSANLKEWTYQSHITGFWECPELFELPVDGDPANTMWVMYGALGTYMLGQFDGKVFTPSHGKYYYTSGTVYAAQTFTNIPAEDGRRIQIGWGRVDQPGMPFNGMMLLPTELTLRTTKDGPRLFSVPVREVERLFTLQEEHRGFTQREANEILSVVGDPECLRIKTTIKLSHATNAGLSLNGRNIIDYDLNSNMLNGMFYSPQDMTSTELTADIFIDRTSVEVFIDGGVYSYSLERTGRPGDISGLHFWGNNIQVQHLALYSVDNIW